MTTSTFVAARRARRVAAFLLRLPQQLFALAGAALVVGSALHAAAVALPTASTAIQPLVPGSASASQQDPLREQARAATAPLPQDQADDDDEGADGGPPPEPLLEQIPAVPQADAYLLDVRRRATGAAAGIARRPRST